MRKIEKEMIAAIRNRESWAGKNTTVNVSEHTTCVYLHGHKIATYWHETQCLEMSMCGWPTVTTRSRLNAICDAFRTRGHFYQCDHVQHFDAMVYHPDTTVTVRQVKP